MRKTFLTAVVSLTFLLAACGGGSDGGPGQYDAFASCLTEQGAKMYGAYWCPHCANQKQMFGASWDEVDYIECSLPNQQGQTQACNLAGIQSYPTWEFADGTRRTGVLSFEQLSEITGCEIQSGEA